MDLDWPTVEAELRDSKAEIEDQLGRVITAFAFPYAFPQANRPFVSHFSQLLRDTGYECCVTTEIGRTGPDDDRLRLRRLPMNGCDDDALLRAKLEGAYDWVALLQLAVKKAKNFFALRRSHLQLVRPDSAPPY
jgi:hypothetical protein